MSARAGSLVSLSRRLHSSLTHEARAITSGLKDISGFREYHKNVRCMSEEGVGIRLCGHWTIVVVGFCSMPFGHIGVDIPFN